MTNNEFKENQFVIIKETCAIGKITQIYNDDNGIQKFVIMILDWDCEKVISEIAETDSVEMTKYDGSSEEDLPITQFIKVISESYNNKDVYDDRYRHHSVVLKVDIIPKVESLEKQLIKQSKIAVLNELLDISYRSEDLWYRVVDEYDIKNLIFDLENN